VISPVGGIRQRGVSASKRRFFEKKRAKNFIRLATLGGRRGRSLQTQGAKRRHEVFLLLFVHKKKTFLASRRPDFNKGTESRRSRNPGR
jgi:hypothetical protein